MRGVVNNVKILGICSAVPSNVVSNTEYIQQLENRRIRKQIELTGIERRRVCIKPQTATDLAVVAADNLLDRLGWDRNEISVLIYVTQSPELSRPATAFLIQQTLKVGKECLVYDINMGCSGFIGGLETIASILGVTKGRGLLLVGESHAMETGEINTSSLLVGDAASAMAVEYQETADNISFAHFSDGSRANLIYRPFNKPGFMDGNAVLLFGLNDVVDRVKEYHRMNNIGFDEIDYYVFHQAQKMIVDGISQGVGIPSEKVLLSCMDYGNTSSASIPLTISVCLSDSVSEKLHLMLCGFGIGLSWGIVDIMLDAAAVYPLIETDKVVIDREWFS